MYLWCRSNKHGCPLPLPCTDCNRWFLRLDHHLLYDKKHKLLSAQEQDDIIREARNSCWDRGATKDTKAEEEKGTEHLQTSSHGQTATSEVADKSDEEKTDFVRRSAPANLPSAPSMPDKYLPKNALELTPTLRKSWGIKTDDYFTIYYNDAESLLKAFKSSLTSLGLDETMANQHQNHVELIWSVVSKEMRIFPIHPISNLHLFRDYYHYPTFKMIGKKKGVQAGTLRSRFTSLIYFIQFLRKHQVFAGMLRTHLKLLEDCVNDFNKELNPFIKQRKVTVRREKVRCHLFPAHFIKYGRSTAIQDLLKCYDQFKNAAQTQVSKKLTRTFVIQFRDYLITSLVIGNGLRASNVIQLHLKDFEQYKVVKDYAGRKVITNDNYKTSTIYGEKFSSIGCLI